MDRKDFSRALAQHSLPSVLLFEGEEEQLKQEALEELRRAVQRGLASLPEEYRVILILRELNGLSYAEIGETLQLEEGTVKSRLFRARKKLCEFLQRDGNLPDTYASKNVNGGGKS